MQGLYKKEQCHLVRNYQFGNYHELRTIYLNHLCFSMFMMTDADGI